MKKEILKDTILPDFDVEICVGDNEFSEGLAPGMIRINLINSAGGVGRSVDMPYPSAPPVDNDTVIPSVMDAPEE